MSLTQSPSVANLQKRGEWRPSSEIVQKNDGVARGGAVYPEGKTLESGNKQQKKGKKRGLNYNHQVVF